MWACGRRRFPGFRANPAAPSRLAVRTSGCACALAADVPGHSGGSTPESHRLPLPPTNDGAIVALCDTEMRPSMTINLTRIYTRRGDAGETDLGDRTRVSKDDPRIDAYGEVDELGAHLGVALTLPDLPARTAAWLRRIQNDLFDVGADLAVPLTDDRERLRLAAEQVTWLEQRCDEVNATLAPLRSFVL